MTKRVTIPAAILDGDKDKAARVEQERARLMELFGGAEPGKKDFIRDAVQQLSWLGITILELQADVDNNGPVVPYQNGKGQSGLQANPACKILKDYQQLHNTLFRALLPVLPDKEVPGGKLDEMRREFGVGVSTKEEREESYRQQMEALRQIRDKVKQQEEQA